MKKHYGNVVLVTGASSGIGKSCAEYLAGLGFRVYGTSRKAPEPREAAAHGVDGNGGDAAGNTVTMIRMDVCSEESVKAAVDYIIDREGGIGIVINNAGMGIAGSVEDTSTEEAMLQFDTNFFGVHRVIRQVLPHMRKKGRGLIVNISSVGALFPIPFQSMYVASKAAVELMSGSLRNELRQFGIKVCVVEPGDTKTGFTGNRLFAEAGGESSAYYQKSRESIAVMERDEMNGPDPIVVAKAVARAIGRKNPPAFITVGMGYKLLVFLRRFVPRSLESFVVARMYKC
ncbi:MAG TPA: SDR family oxidoreductase [Clostridiales bacterium]|nr:SDR family oxidoreductase [Clostridiales bacterium]HPV01293.1 SDR family oxidoreductase [Clostridiales bacterium]